VVAREHQHVQRPVRADQVHVLPQGIGRALVPVGAAPLLRRDDLDELTELAAQVTPAALDVLDQRVRLVLGEHRDLANARVDAVRQREVDDAELAAERRGRLAAILGQVPESLAAPAGHDHGQRAAGQATEVTARGKHPLLFGRHAALHSVDVVAMLQSARDARHWGIAAVAHGG
jgi:hypothetical protein